MGWRSVIITQPAYLALSHRAMQIRLDENSAQIPLEDMAVLLIDSPQVTLSAQLLSACAEAQIAVISVGSSHHPNGVFLPFLSHSRTLKVMRAQLALGTTTKKQLHKTLIKRKVLNQLEVLKQTRRLEFTERLARLAGSIRSGDPDNVEGQAAHVYFRALFASGFSRGQGRFYNAALNYGYAVLRAAIARSLTCYGFLPAFGLFHCNEQNSFNLADDLIEPYRPIIDRWVCTHYSLEPDHELEREDKAHLVSLLHEDVVLTSHRAGDGACTVLAGVDATVMSLARVVLGLADAKMLVMPCLDRVHFDSDDSVEKESCE